MNGKIKILIAFLIIGSLVAFGVFKYAMKPVDDVATMEATQNFSFAELIEKTNSDTTQLNQLRDKVVSVKGFIKKISEDANSKTIELGDSTSESSIICQLDQRHLSKFTTIKELDEITIKGKLVAYTIDTDLGLGNTIEMNFCTTN